MKNIVLLFSLGVFSLFLLQSCKNQKVVVKDVPADKIEKTYNAKIGETLLIEIRSNVTTGYQWYLDNKIKPKVVTFISKEYIQDDVSMDMLGVGGKEVWKFEPKKAGEAFLYFTYKRDDGKIEKEKYFKVIVKE
jgi:predicted secreted protein